VSQPGLLYCWGPLCAGCGWGTMPDSGASSGQCEGHLRPVPVKDPPGRVGCLTRELSEDTRHWDPGAWTTPPVKNVCAFAPRNHGTEQHQVVVVEVVVVVRHGVLGGPARRDKKWLQVAPCSSMAHLRFTAALIAEPMMDQILCSDCHHYSTNDGPDSAHCRSAMATCWKHRSGPDHDANLRICPDRCSRTSESTEKGPVIPDLGLPTTDPAVRRSGPCR
jgi:hypothetical protein